jgi:hypothetical protein
MAIVATLMAGVLGLEAYGLDEKGQVFVLDAKGMPLEPPASEPLAAKVREAIARSTSGAMIYYMWPTKDEEAWIVATRVEGDLKTAFKAAKAAGLPRPVPVDGLPAGAFVLDRVHTPSNNLQP